MFAYIATLFKGSITLTTPMLWALGFIAEFLIGGVTGIFLGSSAFDIYAHDTYFVIAHFHYALFPTVIFGGMTGITYWFPKFTGKMMNPLLGKTHFWLTTIGFNLLFLPLFFVGLAGQHRRIFNYSAWPELITQDLQNLRVAATIGMLIICFGQIFLFWNIFISLRKGKPAGNNPWNANSLEWVAPSPPGHGNFAEIPTVYRGPYEYSVEGEESDFLPQNQPPTKKEGGSV